MKSVNIIKYVDRIVGDAKAESDRAVVVAREIYTLAHASLVSQVNVSENRISRLELTGAELHGKASQSTMLISLFLTMAGLFVGSCALLVATSSLVVGLAVALKIIP